MSLYDEKTQSLPNDAFVCLGAEHDEFRALICAILLSLAARDSTSILADPAPCAGVADAIDEQHATAGAEAILLAPLCDVSSNPSGRPGANVPNVQKRTTSKAQREILVSARSA